MSEYRLKSIVVWLTREDGQLEMVRLRPPTTDTEELERMILEQVTDLAIEKVKAR